MKFSPSFDTTPIGVHVFCVIFYELISIIGNSFVLFIFTKQINNKNAGNVYIIALAILDLLMSLLVLPQFPFLNDYMNNQSYIKYKDICFATMESIIVCYLCIVIAMAIERANAVFRPFSFKPSVRKNAIRVIMIVLSATLLLFVIKFKAGTLNDIITQWSMISTIAICLILLVIIYPAMGYNLYRRQNVAVHNLNNFGNTGSLGNPPNSHRNNSMHISSNLHQHKLSSIEAQGRHASNSTVPTGSSNPSSSHTYGQPKVCSISSSLDR